MYDSTGTAVPGMAVREHQRKKAFGVPIGRGSGG
jgi:hypothetical protein